MTMYESSNLISVTRTIDKIFSESEYTGELLLTGRKLKTLPTNLKRFNLIDLHTAEISWNHLTDICEDILTWHSLEVLNFSHNLIRYLPCLSSLQILVELNLGNNQLCSIPPNLFQLPQLQILLLNNNKLEHVPEQIGNLSSLALLDLSNNDLTVLPVQTGDLVSLKQLSLRRNNLIELPICLSRLRLERLDVSNNKIAHIPCDFRKVGCLQELLIDGNPLVSPPLQVCMRGLVHIMKFLEEEVHRHDPMSRRTRMTASSFRSLRLKRSSSFSIDGRFGPNPERTKSMCNNNNGNMSKNASLDNRNPHIVQQILQQQQQHRHSRSRYTRGDFYSNNTSSSCFNTPNINSRSSSICARQANSYHNNNYSNYKYNINNNGQHNTHNDARSQFFLNGHLLYDHGSTSSLTTSSTISNSSTNNIKYVDDGEDDNDNEVDNEDYDHDAGQFYNVASNTIVNNDYDRRNDGVNLKKNNSLGRNNNVKHDMRDGYDESLKENNHTAVNMQCLRNKNNGINNNIGNSNNISNSLSIDNNKNVIPVDAISIELQRQKAEYEAKKKKVEQLKLKLGTARSVNEKNRIILEHSIFSKKQDNNNGFNNINNSSANNNNTAMTNNTKTNNNNNIINSNNNNSNKCADVASYRSNKEGVLSDNDNDSLTDGGNPKNNNSLKSIASINGDSGMVNATNDATNDGNTHKHYISNGSSLGSKDNSNHKSNNNSDSAISSPSFSSTSSLLSPSSPTHSNNNNNNNKNNNTANINSNSHINSNHNNNNSSSNCTFNKNNNSVNIVSNVNNNANSQHNVTNNTNVSSISNKSSQSRGSITSISSLKNAKSNVRTSHHPPSSSHQTSRQTTNAQQANSTKTRTTTQSNSLPRGVVPTSTTATDHTSTKSKCKLTNIKVPAMFRKSSNLPPNGVSNNKNTDSKSEPRIPRQTSNKSQEDTSNHSSSNTASNAAWNLSEKELLSVEKMKKTFEILSKSSLSSLEDVVVCLRDGVLLCQLANLIKPRSITSIHISSPSAPIISQAKIKRNIDNFLMACRKIGLDQSQICASSSILEHINLASIATTVNALASLSSKFQHVGAS